MADLLFLKFAHVAIAIVALGTSAGLGVVLELFGDDPVHGAFVLRAIRRVERLVVLPGYAWMLLSGLWLASLAWPMTSHWIEAAIVSWLLGAIALVGYLPILDRQIEEMESKGPATPRCRKLARAGRLVGAAGGLVVIWIVYLMVVKPDLPYW